MKESIAFGIAWLTRSAKTGEVEVVDRSLPIRGTTLEELRASADQSIRAGGMISGFQIWRPDGGVVAERLPPS